MKTLQIPDSSPVVRGLIDLVDDEPIIIRSSGRSFAVCEVDEGDIEVMALNENPKFWEILEKSRRRAEKEGWLTTEELKASLGLTDE